MTRKSATPTDDQSGLSEGNKSDSSSSSDLASDTSQIESSKSLRPNEIPAHLFLGNENFEDLFEVSGQPPDEMSSIEVYQRGRYVESWDPKLSDPETLYQFLRYQASIPPNMTIRCRGISYVKLSKELCKNCQKHGKRKKAKKDVHKVQSKNQTAPERIVDFNFTIGLNDILNHDHTSGRIDTWTSSPSMPTYRGSHWARFAAQSHLSGTHLPGSLGPMRRFPLTRAGKTPSRKEASRWSEWETYREKRGVPGWVNMETIPDFWERFSVAMGSSKDPNKSVSSLSKNQASLREWCEAFCADKGILKEFWLTKEISGWDFHTLKRALRNTILSTGYEGKEVEIHFNYEPKYVVVRSNNWFSKALGSPFIYFLSWVTAVYPLFYVFKCVFPRIGGAPWSVACANYALKAYKPLPTTYPDESLTSAQDRVSTLRHTHPEVPENAILQYGPDGIYYLVGKREGEWFKEWEAKIKLAVKKKFKGVLDEKIEIDNMAAKNLDGYQ
ncbi:uncharacterized protein IL334_005843 [Kwoniella shivajii]|uniref:Uncharacterized protein n=1 Tax=Kwoniella shivajii TaxID=564305 RepID=A0ABZ1D893_9TREE|nr:hypothetical protein IL334_005843 [Kwoniella shivajii]